MITDRSLNDWVGIDFRTDSWTSTKIFQRYQNSRVTQLPQVILNARFLRWTCVRKSRRRSLRLQVIPTDNDLEIYFGYAFRNAVIEYLALNFCPLETISPKILQRYRRLRESRNWTYTITLLKTKVLQRSPKLWRMRIFDIWISVITILLMEE